MDAGWNFKKKYPYLALFDTDVDYYNLPILSKNMASWGHPLFY